MHIILKKIYCYRCPCWVDIYNYCCLVNSS